MQKIFCRKAGARLGHSILPDWLFPPSTKSQEPSTLSKQPIVLTLGSVACLSPCTNPWIGPCPSPHQHRFWPVCKLVFLCCTSAHLPNNDDRVGPQVLSICPDPGSAPKLEHRSLICFTRFVQHDVGNRTVLKGGWPISRDPFSGSR